MFPVFRVLDVADGMSVKSILFVEICHCTLPVFPVNAIAVVPEPHTPEAAVAVPATEG